MTIRRWMPIWLLVLAPPAAGLAQGPPAHPLHTLLIILDDNDWEYYGFLGHPAAHTPNLDRILSTGCVFRHGYVTASTCRPSLASLLCGRYPHEHGITNNLVPQSLPIVDIFPMILRDAGYATFIGGKFWERTGGELDTEAYGFTHSEGIRGGFRHTFVRAGQEGFLRFIETMGDQPWLAFYAPLLPHLPTAGCPQQFVDQIDPQLIPVPAWINPGLRDLFVAESRAYLGNLAWLDWAIGEVLTQLEVCGQLDNTMIITLSDNGWGYGFVSKQSPFEKGVRTQISFTWGDRVAPRVVDDLVSSVDIPATVLDYAGLQAPESYSGFSLRQRIEGGPTPVREELYGLSYSIRPYPGMPPPTTLVAFWLNDGRYKYVRYFVNAHSGYSFYLEWTVLYTGYPVLIAGQEQLFDLESDPHERRDLMVGKRDYTETVRRLRARASAVLEGIVP